jgi:hypothetical protein
MIFFGVRKSVFLSFEMVWIKHCVSNQWRDTVFRTA